MELLYLSYDGLLEPLGQSQVVTYVTGLALAHQLTLVSYEKRRDVREPDKLREMAARLQACGIRWIRLRYHKRPSFLATGWDVLCGIAIGAAVCARRRIRVIHTRGYVASVVGLCLKRLFRTKLVFDMRGFWADEKVDAGHWRPGSAVYRLAKRWERRFFKGADAIVSLTQAGVEAFASLGYAIPPTTIIEVIPTCADLARFVPGPKDPALLDQLRLRGRTVVGCVGTLSNWYLREPTLRYLALLARRLEAVTILCVTQEDQARLRTEALAAGIPDAQLVVTQADFAAMPTYLRLMDLGVFFIQASFSKRGSAPTKLAELLATGVPVVINEGIGDSGGIVRDHQVGVVLPALTPPLCEASVEDVRRLLSDPACRLRCRRVAERHFDLTEGIRRYLEVYRRLESSPARSRVVGPPLRGTTRSSSQALPRE